MAGAGGFHLRANKKKAVGVWAGCHIVLVKQSFK